MFSLLLAWTSWWLNSGIASDLRYLMLMWQFCIDEDNIHMADGDLNSILLNENTW